MWTLERGILENRCERVNGGTVFRWPRSKRGIMGMGNNYIRIQKEERGALSETDSDRNILDGGLCLIRY